MNPLHIILLTLTMFLISALAFWGLAGRFPEYQTLFYCLSSLFGGGISGTLITLFKMIKRERGYTK